MAIDYMQILNQLAPLIVLLLMLNYLTANFLFVFLKVRMKRAKSICVRVHALPELYHKEGKFDGSTIIYKNRHKQVKRIRPSTGLEHEKDSDGKDIYYSKSLSDYVYKSMGISFIDIDDEKNSVMNPRKFTTVQGYDAVALDSIITRVITAPQLKNKFELMVLAALVIIILLSAASTVISFQNYKLTNQIPELIRGMTGVI